MKMKRSARHPRTKGRRWSVATLVLLLLCAVASGPAESGETHVAVVVSHDGGPARETLQGFREQLEKRGIRARYTIHFLGGDPGRVPAAFGEIRAARPDLLFTLGILAGDAAARELPAVPSVAGLVPRAEMLRKGSGRAVVQLEFPIDTQLRWIRRLLPEARSVGVIYNAAENRGRIDAAARAARSMGLSIEAREVRSPRDIPAALESLATRVDALWGLYDSVVIAPETARRILLISFRNKVPVVGPSASWVRAGALFSLEWDHADLGAQCGELAAEILHGRSPGAFTVTLPRKVAYVVNLNTARRIGIEVSEPLARGARQTFRGGE